MPLTDVQLVVDAISLARNAHMGQVDKAGVAYINHVLWVGVYVMENGGSPQEIAAGFLHDAAEDTDVTLSQIEVHFGADVADMVDAVSRRHGETYRDFIRRAKAHSAGARLIKTGDVRHHLLRSDPTTAHLHSRYKWAEAELTTP